MGKLLKISVDGVELEQSCELSSTLEQVLRVHDMGAPEWLKSSRGQIICPKWELAHRWNGDVFTPVSSDEVTPEFPAIEAAQLSLSPGPVTN